MPTAKPILRTFRHAHTYDADSVLYTCPETGELLEVVIDAEALTDAAFTGTGVWRYAPYLPVDRRFAQSIGEGGTGLHHCPRLAKAYGVKELYVKNEGENPTGSFKDRGMTVGIAQAIKLGAKAVACASTGNTSASMAAYAARAGLPAIVLVPTGKVALGKIAQAVIYGARIVQIDGNFDVAMKLVHELSVTEKTVYLLNSINPYRLEGQKTLAFEVCEQLGGPPDTLMLPMGNAGNISAIWKGLNEFHRSRRIDRLPLMIGAQAEGACPIVRAHALGDQATECYEPNPETVATAIRIGAPINWRKALAALHESRGCCGTVSDEEILEAQSDLARLEGIFVEPASAAPLALLKKAEVPGERIVVVTTGNGLKDPDAVMRQNPRFIPAEPDVDSLRKALDL